MKRIMSSVIMGLALVGAMATSALAVPFNGPSVSFNSAEFNFGGGVGSNLFTTAVAGSGVVGIEIQNSAGVPVLTDSSASLIVTGVNFSSGLLSGTGGGFSIYDGINATGTLLLSGLFGNSSITTISGAASQEFKASTIVTFVNYAPLLALLGSETFGAPGEFSSTLGNVASPLALGGNWTTGLNVGGHIYSSVPEPTSLLLLGAGLAFVGGWQWMKRKGFQA